MVQGLNLSGLMSQDHSQVLQVKQKATYIHHWENRKGKRREMRGWKGKVVREWKNSKDGRERSPGNSLQSFPVYFCPVRCTVSIPLAKTVYSHTCLFLYSIFFLFHSLSFSLSPSLSLSHSLSFVLSFSPFAPFPLTDNYMQTDSCIPT